MRADHRQRPHSGLGRWAGRRVRLRRQAAEEQAGPLFLAGSEHGVSQRPLLGAHCRRVGGHGGREGAAGEGGQAEAGQRIDLAQVDECHQVGTRFLM